MGPRLRTSQRLPAGQTQLKIANFNTLEQPTVESSAQLPGPLPTPRCKKLPLLEDAPDLPSEEDEDTGFLLNGRVPPPYTLIKGILHTHQSSEDQVKIELGSNTVTISREQAIASDLFRVLTSDHVGNDLALFWTGDPPNQLRYRLGGPMVKRG